MSANTIQLPPRPEEPAPGECCESGCDPCVLDLYYEALREWEAEVARLKAAAADLESQPANERKP
jgi:cytochrome-b5 reductase